jgi:hypothetical protein
VHVKYIPWQLKFAAKLVLSRLPINYQVWKRAGIFDLGGMNRPQYALDVFRRHFTSAVFARKEQDFTALELGPGDSQFSGLVARTFGAAHTYLIDVGPFASTNLEHFRKTAAYLNQVELHPPDLRTCSTFREAAIACGLEYLTDGIASLRSIPSGSVDFVWSHATLAHIRHDELLPTLIELRRVQRLDGIGSHHTGFGSVLGGGKNDVRFSERVWESRFIAKSGFYTNRIHCEELLRLFRIAGFAPEIVRRTYWKTLPIPRDKMAAPFRTLPEQDLQLRTIDVHLHSIGRCNTT